MNKVESYLREQFKKRRWYFLSLIETIQACGEETIEELKELKTKGLVQSREGCNGPLIELLDWKNKWM